jgi:hypothetical protein
MPIHGELTGKSQQKASNASASSIGKFKSDNSKVGSTANASGYKTRTSATDVSSVHADFKSRSKNAAN